MSIELDLRALDALKNNQRQLDADGCEVGVSRQALDELIAAYETDARVSLPQPAQAVKTLEWEGAGDTCVWANVRAWWLSYRISLRVDRMHSLQLEWLGNRNDHIGVYPTWDEAKAAAQADYEQRILSAIARPAPLMDEVEAVLKLSRAASDVLAERRRQIEAEGWTPEHDDGHDNGEMAEAAACYARGATGINYIERLGMRGHVHRRRTVWPWSIDWWKPSDPRRNLVKAGALILAEIERLDRLTKIQEGGR